jgi:anti-anti-sigma factor
MAFQIEPREIALVKLSGRFDSENARQIGEQTTQVIKDRCVRLIVIMDQVSFINSAALRELNKLLKACRSEGGDVVLAPGESKKSWDVLRMTGLIESDPRMKPFKTVSTEEALKSPADQF